ncbi:MAG: hypothetical protein JXA54_06700 [Candidatus Heimdallarchaeota archaeon]|nr:hypothetical protein [Candidatus Heimdallarchaeota archaeon]
MFDKLLGFISLQKKIERKLLQLAFIPSKYFEALYIECCTDIPCHPLDIYEVEEKQIRGELLELMKQGEVDTKIELEKFQLFERINSVIQKSKEVRLYMSESAKVLDKKDYEKLVVILKEISFTGKLMYKAMQALYEDYSQALIIVEELEQKGNEIVERLFKFKYYVGEEDQEYDFSLEKPEVIIGDAIRTTLQNMINVGEKIMFIIKKFSYHHAYLNEIDKDDSKDEEDDIKTPKKELENLKKENRRRSRKGKNN